MEVASYTLLFKSGMWDLVAIVAILTIFLCNSCKIDYLFTSNEPLKFYCTYQ